MKSSMLAALFALCLSFAAAPVALGLAPAPQVGTTQMINDVNVRVDSYWPGGLSRGWAPVYVEFRNDGTRDRQIDVRAGSRWTNRMSSTEQRLSKALEPNETGRFELLLPVDRTGGNADYNVTVTVGRDVGVFSLSLGESSPHELARVLCVLSPNGLNALEVKSVESALPMDDGTLVRGVFDGSTPPVPSSARWHGGASSQAARVFTVPLADLPRRTPAWSSVDTVVVDARGPLPGDVRWGPLIEWLRGGGQLAFVGEGALGAVGAIEALEALLDERFLLERTNEMAAYRAGFGTLLFQTPLSPSSPAFPLTVRAESVEVLANVDRHSGVEGVASSALAEVYRPRLGAASPWSRLFPTKGLPLRPVVAFLFLFAIVVGPLNVVFARRKKRPSLLFITVPVLSFAATVMIVLFGVLRQGFSNVGFAHSVAIVDQVEARATTIERREMVLGRGGTALRPAPGTTALVPDDGRVEARRLVRDDGNQMELAGEFLPVRSQTRHLTVRDAPTRLRLDVERKGTDELEVTNGLGVDLVLLELRGPGDEWYTHEETLRAGDKALLRRGGDGGACASALSRNEPMFYFVDAPEFGYAAIASSSPTADDASVELEEILGTHAVVGYLDPQDGGWTR